MGCDGGPPPSAIVADARAFKEQDRNHSDGVQYVDQLADQLTDDVKRPLRMRVRSPRGLLPVNVFWKHNGDRGRSKLWVDLPDEVYRLVHLELVRNMAQMLGVDPGALQLPELVRAPQYCDGQRRPRGDDVEVILPTWESWPTLLDAIRCTAADKAGLLGGQLINLFPYDDPVRVRVDKPNGHMVVTLMPETVQKIEDELTKAFRSRFRIR